MKNQIFVIKLSQFERKIQVKCKEANFQYEIESILIKNQVKCCLGGSCKNHVTLERNGGQDFLEIFGFDCKTLWELFKTFKNFFTKFKLASQKHFAIQSVSTCLKEATILSEKN